MATLKQARQRIWDAAYITLRAELHSGAANHIHFDDDGHLLEEGPELRQRARAAKQVLAVMKKKAGYR